MSRIISITEQRRFRANQRVTNLPKELKIGPVSLKFICIILVVVITAAYLGQKISDSMRTQATQGLEDKKNNIILENERLSIEADRLQTLSKVDAAATKLGMVQVSDLKFANQDANQK